MVGQITFTICAFILFLYILLNKFIKKNDTTYLIILGIQTIGIILNYIRITFDILNELGYTIILYVLCIAIPIIVFIFEMKNINISVILRIIMAKICLLFRNQKKAKKILNELVKKYNQSYMGHKMLAGIYEEEGGMRRAIEEYVNVLDIKKNDYNTYYRISVLLNDLGKEDEAIEMFTKLLKNRPQITEASKILRR